MKRFYFKRRSEIKKEQKIVKCVLKFFYLLILDRKTLYL